jgi:hypothetical protein
MWNLLKDLPGSHSGGEVKRHTVVLESVADIVETVRIADAPLEDVVLEGACNIREPLDVRHLRLLTRVKFETKTHCRV